MGLGDVEVLGVDGEAGAPLRVHVRGGRRDRAAGPAVVMRQGNGERPVELVELRSPGVEAGVAQAALALPAAGVLWGCRH